jgi:long-chain acyl-CoA synthetase
MIATLPSHLWSRRGSTAPAQRQRRNGAWVAFDWREYCDAVEDIAAFLHALALPRGSRVVIFANTHPAWAWADMAIMSLGHVTVPVYHNAAEDELVYILNHSRASVVFVENQKIWNRLRPLLARAPAVTTLISFERVRESEVIGLSDVRRRGLYLRQGWPRFLTAAIDRLRPEDLATVVYTSGTTGVPKGVELRHRQVVAEIEGAFPRAGVNSGDVLLAFLPWAHILGRVEHWGSVRLGYEVCFADGVEKIVANLAEVEPTVMVAVPRIFEKIHLTLAARVATHPLLRKLFARSNRLASRWARATFEGRGLSFGSAIEAWFFRLFIFRQVRALFGSRFRFCVSGGAPLNRELAEFFWACRVQVLEGYGLTETTGAVTVNWPEDFRFGTVGKPIDGVEIRLDVDGEILVRGDVVMRGYHCDDEATRQIMTDGWLRTGDIGEWNDGFLRITDRKKDLIKTAGGKYVAPQRLEGLVKLHPLVGHVLIHGDKRKHVVALVTIDRPSLVAWARERGWSLRGGSVAEHPEILAEVQRHFRAVNAKLASFETIKAFRILDGEFSVEGGELTPSLKVRRKFCDEKYKADLDALFVEQI